MRHVLLALLVGLGLSPEQLKRGAKPYVRG